MRCICALVCLFVAWTPVALAIAGGSPNGLTRSASFGDTIPYAMRPVSLNPDKSKHDGKPSGDKPGSKDGSITINVNNGVGSLKDLHNNPHGKPNCPEGFDSLMGQCYLVSSFGTTRADALRYCHALGGDLIALDGPRINYALKYLIHMKDMSAFDFWTSGIYMHRGWYWETTNTMVDFKNFKPDADISDEEKAKWSAPLKRSQIRSMADYLKLDALTDDTQCILLGPHQEGGQEEGGQEEVGVAWKKQGCLHTTANFICKSRRPLPTPRGVEESEEEEEQDDVYTVVPY